MRCRACNSPISFELIDFGSSPLSNAYLTRVSMRRPEKWFPLRVLVCESCWLVQAEAYSRAAEIFNDEYAYFSSFSDAWLAHSSDYCTLVRDKLDLDSDSLVVEIASNDGYLLQFFKENSIPCLGVEPTASTAAVSRSKGIPTIETFFGAAVAEDLVEVYGRADLIVANNVLAHVPDPGDFLTGIRNMLAKRAVATLEFPHLLKLITQNQFDTIYHEHFSYLSFTAVVTLLAKTGLQAFQVEELSTHGGSLRIWIQDATEAPFTRDESVVRLLERERQAGISNLDFYRGFMQLSLIHI